MSKSDYKHELDIKFPFCLVDSDETQGKLILVPGWWWHSNTYALMRNEKKFEERDRRIDRSIQFIYSPLPRTPCPRFFERPRDSGARAGDALWKPWVDDETNRSLLGDRVFE